MLWAACLSAWHVLLCIITQDISFFLCGFPPEGLLLTLSTVFVHLSVFSLLLLQRAGRWNLTAGPWNFNTGP